MKIPKDGLEYLSLLISIQNHPEDYEPVDTGYEDKEGRELIGEYIFHGQAARNTCRHCGGALKPKKLSVVRRGGRLHVVNGRPKPVEVEGGRLILLWLCSRQCEACEKNQRVFPPSVLGWVRYALTVVVHVLTHLFENDELLRTGRLRRKQNRPWHTLGFYGENNTVYRWRRRFRDWFEEKIRRE
ncbi:hypothetical protein [Eubacterium sp. 1001713B170207_170306_E7]|uniref:hypothetical protein n=1 Tax=Eubacterium sp. 1001713B170207_170306_E7 TaxID=2787097 RepID=UPI00189B6A2C|nr:hypothetical protein [Eubacterium sp. 1001713B170207_170306_E7]